MKLGAHDFMPKPFTPDEFRLIARRALEKRKLVLETLALRHEKEVLRENFAAIVSHELRSPLSAVQQNLYVLSAELSDQMSDDQLHRLERMKSRLSELLDLISTWLRVISLDMESIKDSFTQVSIASVISAAIESVSSMAARKDIKLDVTIREPISPVYGDSGTLCEVFVNVLNNAIKYSRQGSVVKTLAELKGGDIVVSVIDNGVGISDGDLPFIFDDFYSGKRGSQNETGYGLGLALSKRIIDVHIGAINVESELGNGTVFRVHLPAIASESQADDKMRADIFFGPLEGEIR
jgi:signal transduction histidine kinase